MLSLRENFHAVVGATPDAEDLASSVSKEAQDCARSGNLVTDCLLGKKFFKVNFTLRRVDARDSRLEER